MNYFKHDQALVESVHIGDRTNVWAFAHILPHAQVGSDCNICDNVFIENDVIVGNRVTIKCGVQLWDGIRVDDDVFIGPNATFTNDRFPRSKRQPKEFLKSIIRCGASVGANATILPGLTIGKHAMIGAGAVVTRDVPPNAIVVGNPARIVGYVSTSNTTSIEGQTTGESTLIKEHVEFHVPGVKIVELPKIVDMRGSLSFAEIGKHLPFEPKRYFIVFDVPSREVRGEHAHKELHQFLVCVRGSCSVVVDDSKNRQEIVLDRPTIGLHLPPLIWAVQYKYSRDAMLLVLTSGKYDAGDYIRDYDEYYEYMSRQ